MTIEQSGSITLKSSLLVGILIIIPTVSVISTRFTSGVTDSGICVTAVWEDDPLIVAHRGDCPIVDASAPAVTPVPVNTPPASVATPPPVSPVDESFASCNEVEFTANPGVILRCELEATNYTQDVYKITVSTDQTTPILWIIDVNNKNPRGFIRTELDASMAFDRWETNLRTYSISGVDRSWNGDRTDYINAAYVSNKKSYEFMVRNTWRNG